MVDVNSCCVICGLLVGDPETHDQWHTRVDRVAEVADAFGAGGITASMVRWSAKKALRDLRPPD